jgi:hypothetical protein
MPLRRLLAIEIRVPVASDARRLAGKHARVELYKGTAHRNRIPVADELGLHSGEKVIVKRLIQVRRALGLLQLLALLRRLALSVGLA